MSVANAIKGAAARAESSIALVAEDLARVDRRIHELLGTREERIATAARELIEAGGKRVRPGVALLVFRAAGGGSDTRDIVDIAAALELIHSATLMHDDIIDSATTRRGRPSPLARHGIGLTLVTGDFLFSKAFGVAGRFDATIVGWAADACTALCEGEAMQQRLWRAPEVTVEDYLEIAARKTASLFAQAARIGAHIAGADAVVVEAMRRLGHEIGLAFQMIDDLLDVVGPAEVIGKPVGGDLREGVPALPTVLGLRSLPEVRAAFLDPAPAPEAITSALAALRRSTVLDTVRTMARERVATAKLCLDRLAPSPFRSAIADLVDDLHARSV
jgi:geranylgeranyl pyrophosphate synthase